MIEPRILKGFRDMLPQDERIRLRLQDILQRVFRSYGFVPIDTPLLEYTEILLGKGGGETDKQIYRFEDHGGRDVALRFDLTVPFARFMAAHYSELPLPFKRFHMAKVFRGENTQRGRYREFTQCDFDIVGVDSVSADFEILNLMADSFAALGTTGISLRVSHRGLFNQLLDRLGIAGETTEVLRLVDKLRKIGADKVREGLIALADDQAAEDILAFIQPLDNNQATLENMIRLAGGESAAAARLRGVLELATESSMAADVVLDPSITRGLDYYTGIVFETFLSDLPQIGSVCSGGRYNDLAGLYTKQLLPGVGASIGLDRLLAGLDELSRLPQLGPETQVLVFCLQEDCLSACHRVAGLLRADGWRVEVYPEAKKLPKQFAFAEKRGIPLGIIIGPEEQEAGTANLKDLRTRETIDGIPVAHISHQLRELAPEFSVSARHGGDSGL
ncbi:histidine--tRNA ligase [Spirochaeta africana]|uniref:Histidine--tRNA ligase n=1 Tax=Spirochaeta africana (strain ATCC 700263 / DSM 8902 / Z-7692) TaxID=889378 RepID=H9UKN2_SPIAZ|nr:histidine--tRNA ligase [Spirochaeta africana]AFG38075.1 histidyl-tRNA synthetase [Spirochaeta africana DSM 8902]